jgi:holo-[acyl-carrier protein] synthase
MIVGIGVDITAGDRIRQMLERHADRFLARCFTEHEQGYCREFKDPVPHLAARFAAKEAAYKALGGRGPIRWTEMEVRNDGRGKPELFLLGQTLAIAEELGVTRTHISLAHDAGVAVAQVVLEGTLETEE